MKNKHGDQITENMIVRLRSEVTDKPDNKRKSAQITGWVNQQGGVRLSEQLDGFYCWNVDDLEPVPRANG